MDNHSPQSSALRDEDTSVHLQGDGKSARVWCFISVALQGIRSSRFQLALTVLTMSVGAMALALTYFVGQGAIQRMWQDVEEMMGQWVVAHSDVGLDPQWRGGRPLADFTETELHELQKRLPGAKFVCPIYMNEHPVMYGDRKLVLPVDGITEETSHEPLFQALQGPGFSASAWAGMSWECMVTEAARKEFAMDLKQKPLLLVGAQTYRVVGVVPNPPRVDRRFQSRVVVPYSSARILWIPPNTIGHNIIVGWNRVQDMNQIVAGLRQALDDIRGPNTYFLSSSQFSIEKSKDLVTNFMLMGAIQSLFCIIVASIGVLNVMLTSVTRRAHEFSIRLAMGASRRQVLGSVILESVLISFFGALLGLVVAVIAAPHVTSLLASRLPQAGRLAPCYCLQGFLYPFLICCVCGLAAGVLPALRAGRIDVLAALRAEG